MTPRVVERASPKNTYPVFDAIAQTLCELSSSPLFALMGDGNQELIVAFGRRGRQVVEARHEQNAVAMADGYARFARQVGLCTVTQGPGLTNAGTSLAVADRAHSPVLLLAGQSARGDFNNPQYLEQRAFAMAAAGAGATVDAPRALDGAFAQALAHFASGGGAFVLNVPTDVQSAHLEAPHRTFRSARPGSFVPDTAAIEHAVDLMRRARRPAFLAGAGAIDAQHPLVALAERLGAPIAGSLKAKGLAHHHPLSVGVAGRLGDPGAARMLKAADLILAVGASLNAWTTGFGENVGHCPIVQIDRSLAAFGVHTAVDLALVGEAGASLELLRDALGDTRRAPWWSNDDDDPGTEYEDGADGKPDPRRVLDVVNGALPEDRIIVADGGHCVQATCQKLQVGNPHNWTYSFDFGCIGQGLGLALGACFARPSRRVTLITGDASLLMNIGELDTATRCGLPLTIIVLNDDGFGQERHALARKQLPPEYAVLRAPDFVQCVRAVHGEGQRFSTVDDLGALACSLTDAGSGLRLHDVLINGEVELAASGEIARHLR